MTATLIYPAYHVGNPHVAEMDAEVRLTPTQIVLVRPLVETLRYVNGHNKGPTGIGIAKRWKRTTGREIGGSHISWRVSKESLAMIREQPAHAAKGE